MSNKLSDLKTYLKAGARPNKYAVSFSLPSAISSVTSSDFSTADILCRSASFPAMTLGTIEVYNQGRKLPIPGDTSYTNTWTLTFYNTEAHNFRRDFIAWLRYTDHFQNNYHSGNPSAIMGEMYIAQLDSAGEETAKYTFHNVFVSEIGEVQVADDTQDTVEEFDVTFTFSDWVVGDGDTNDPSDADNATENDTAE